MPIYTVPVQLGKRSYDIEIGHGLLKQAGTKIAQLRPGARAGIITDPNLGSHLQTLKQSLKATGIDHQSFVAPAFGEGLKNYTHLEQITTFLLDAKFQRDDLVIALGGGVIGDLAGFAASVTRRGMDFVQIPTSLLAQVDSSVGGKTGINTPHGKNLIGAFHQPIAVLIDLDVLQTLDPRHMRAGYAEVVKYGLIDNFAFFEWLENHFEDVFAHGESLSHAVATSCQAKARVVAQDETEKGQRALLNLGHTFGHALEALTGYSDTLLHGEAISIGMVLAHQFSHQLGHIEHHHVTRVANHFTKVGLPTKLSDIDTKLKPRIILETMTQDKKVKRGALTLILCKGLSNAYIAHNVDVKILETFIDDALQY